MSKPKAKPVLRGITRNVDQAAMSLALENRQTATEPGVVNPSVLTQVGAITSETDLQKSYQVGQKYPIPLFLLARSPHQARVFYADDDVEELYKSLSENKQDVAAVGYVKEGRVYLIDGVKRLQGATKAGLPTLMVEIVAEPQNVATEYEHSRRINLQRSAQTALDDAVRWRALLDQGVYLDQEDLGRRLGIDKGTVSKTLGLNRIPENLLRVMTNHPQTRALSIAYEISSIFVADMFKEKPEEALAFAQDVIEETTRLDLSRDRVIALIKSKLSSPKTRLRGETQHVRYGETKGVLKIVPTRGQISLEFKGLPAGKVEELQSSIEKMLAGQLSI